VIRRCLHIIMLSGLVFITSQIKEDKPKAHAMSCWTWWTTGYARTDFPGYTADGTSVWNGENLVAATSLPLGSYVYVPEWDTRYRVADRGYLSANHLDFLVDTRAEAYEITGWREACPL